MLALSLSICFVNEMKILIERKMEKPMMPSFSYIHVLPTKGNSAT